MQIETNEVGGALIVRPHGRVDSTTSPLLEQVVRTESRLVMLLDLSEVSYISSAGLRLVLTATKAAHAAKGRFAVFGLSPELRSVFHLSGFDRIVTIANTEADALTGTSG